MLKNSNPGRLQQRRIPDTVVTGPFVRLIIFVRVAMPRKYLRLSLRTAFLGVLCLDSKPGRLQQRRVPVTVVPGPFWGFVRLAVLTKYPLLLLRKAFFGVLFA